MKQFLLPESSAEKPGLELGGSDFHYLARVRRFRAGAVFPGMDRNGRRYSVRIREVRVDTLLVEATPVESEPDQESEPASLLSLYQCVPKGNRMDLIIRQATEAGIRVIVPVISRYVVPSPGEQKRERWNRIAREALQQSGNAVPPSIGDPIPLEKIPSIGGSERGLFFHQSPLENKPLHRYLSGDVSGVAIVIGPEGGFPESEIRFLAESGYSPVILGPSILRTETAALYAIAAVQIVLAERKTWVLRNSKG